MCVECAGRAQLNVRGVTSLQRERSECRVHYWIYRRGAPADSGTPQVSLNSCITLCFAPLKDRHFVHRARRQQPPQSINADPVDPHITSMGRVPRSHRRVFLYTRRNRRTRRETPGCEWVHSRQTRALIHRNPKFYLTYTGNKSNSHPSIGHQCAIIIFVAAKGSRARCAYAYTGCVTHW